MALVATASAAHCGEIGEVVGEEMGGVRSVLKVSSENVVKFPILREMRATLARSSHSLQHTLEHSPTLRRFQIEINARNRTSLGFLQRDSLEDCFDILKHAYESGTLSLAIGIRDGGGHASLDECTVIQVHVTEKTLRREPLAYVLLLTETATEGGGDDLCEVGALKKELALWKLRTTVTLASSHCWAAAGALCSMQQLKRIWKPEEGDSAQLFALRDNGCTLLIRAPGVYKFHPLEDNLFVNNRRVARRYAEHLDTGAAAATASYIVRLQVGDRVFVATLCARGIGDEVLHITKL